MNVEKSIGEEITERLKRFVDSLPNDALRAVDQWEYEAIGVNTGMYYDSLLVRLDQLGNEGWELVHITERKADGGDWDDVHLKAYLKRRRVAAVCSTASERLTKAAPRLLAACKRAMELDAVSPNSDEIYNEIKGAIRAAEENDSNQ